MTMSSDLLGKTLGERYVPRSVLGAGANAAIYLAEDSRTGGSVALKALHPELRGARDARLRLEREGRIAGGLNHPNVCRVTDVGRLPDESPFLVMELLVGESLSARLRREGSISVEGSIDIAYQVLAGVGAAHRLGVVHRDLKPDNVFLVPVGPRSTIAKVLDFGGALTNDAANGPEMPLTGAGLVVGTPSYMTPEQAQGARDFDGRTDVYVCGSLLFVMLSGQLPFVAPNVRSLMEAIAFSTPRSIGSLCPALPPVLVAIIETAMARERSERYATAEDFQQALVTVISADAPGSIEAITRRLRPQEKAASEGGEKAKALEATRPDWDKPTRPARGAGRPPGRRGGS